MNPQPTPIEMRLNEANVASLRTFLDITDEDLRRLASLHDFAERYADEIVEDFYAQIVAHPEASKLFADHVRLEHVKRAQRDYFLGLFSGTCDLAYAEDRLRIGIAHERAGVPPRWYLGSYARYLRCIYDHLERELEDPRQARLAYDAVAKLVAFDTGLAMDTYVEAHLQTIARHQLAIRELSTPVIRIHDRVLLLPLIGTVDTRRAEQLMQAILTKVVEQQARVIIIDIAGVAVVDTEVADHLIKTTDAVHLLGTQTILSGISPTVAKTVVHLGVDISTVHTRSQLSDAIELAFELLGKGVVRRPPRARRRAR